MEENEKTTSDQNKEKASSDVVPVKKKRIRKEPEENKTKIHPEQYEEFINEIPDEEKSGEANEIKNNNTDQNEIRP
jgi:hypothetical protein